FFLQPYFEHGMKEFGLGMPSDSNRASHYGFMVDPSTVEENYITDMGAPQLNTGIGAGGILFSAENFDALAPERWMEGIGMRFGETEASPALAWLIAKA